MLTAFDMEHGRCFFFNTHSASLSERRDYRVADAALATSAAPVYFPPASITSVDDTHKLLADGGLYANTPAVCAYVEAHKLYGSEPLFFLWAISALPSVLKVRPEVTDFSNGLIHCLTPCSVPNRRLLITSSAIFSRDRTTIYA